MIDNAENREKFATIIATLAEMFNRKMSPVSNRGYWMGLSDLELPQLEIAAELAIRRCKFMPSVQELREFAGDAPEETRATKAWDEFLGAVQSHGPYKHVDFEDGIINATVRNLGGWPEFISRLSNSQEEKWARLDFIKTYSKFFRSGINGEVAKALPGFAQKQVIDGELREVKPVRIASSQPPPAITYRPKELQIAYKKP